LEWVAKTFTALAAFYFGLHGGHFQMGVSMWASMGFTGFTGGFRGAFGWCGLCGN